jgi:hypothetical protein
MKALTDGPALPGQLMREIIRNEKSHRICRTLSFRMISRIIAADGGVSQRSA